MNMSLSNKLVLFVCSFFFLTGIAQKDHAFNLKIKKREIVKSGTFLGLERGKYFTLNFGVERQWQTVKLVKPRTSALNLQFDYNLFQNTIGMQAGIWSKSGRMNITYGARLFWRTDFSDHHQFGFAPNVGYKIAQAQLQLGVNIARSPNFDFIGNVFYASLRWVFVQSRSVKKG
jgi:hypothetical protein